MALTLTTPDGAHTGAAIHGGTASKYVIKRILFDSSYASGGESLTAADLGFTAVHMVIVDVEDSGFVGQYDYSGEKVALYSAGADAEDGLDEVANTTDVSAVYARVLAYGLA